MLLLTELFDLAHESRGMKRKREVAFSMLSSPSTASESLSSDFLESVSSSPIVVKNSVKCEWKDVFEDVDCPDDDDVVGDYSGDDDGDGVEEYPLEDDVDPAADSGVCVDWEDSGYCNCWMHPAVQYESPDWYEPHSLTETHSDTDSDSYKLM